MNINSEQLKIEIIKKYRATYIKGFTDIFICLILFGLSLLLTKMFGFVLCPFLYLMLYRCFVLYHDLGHLNWFPNELLNIIFGHIFGCVTLASPIWHYSHAMHHRVNGNLTNKLKWKWSDTILYTVEQYQTLPKTEQLLYRFFRDPLVFFTIFPPIYFMILHRFKGIKSNTLHWFIHNMLVICWLYFINWFGILPEYLLTVISGYITGFIFFHNQHTFNPGYPCNNEKWTLYDSGAFGSSFIQIPRFLKYFTVGIEYHNIHHFIAKIPGYNLQRCYEENKEFHNAYKLSLVDCLYNLRLTLFDNINKRFISFNELARPEYRPKV